MLRSPSSNKIVGFQSIKRGLLPPSILHLLHLAEKAEEHPEADFSLIRMLLFNVDGWAMCFRSGYIHEIR